MRRRTWLALAAVVVCAGIAIGCAVWAWDQAGGARWPSLRTR